MDPAAAPGVVKNTRVLLLISTLVLSATANPIGDISALFLILSRSDQGLDSGDSLSDDNPADGVPLNHDTALTYIVSFGIILLTVLIIVAFVLGVKLRKRAHKRKLEAQRTEGSSGEKTSRIHTQSRPTLSQMQSLNMKATDMARTRSSRFLQFDHQLPCRCAECLLSLDGVSFQIVSTRRNSRSQDAPSRSANPDPEPSIPADLPPPHTDTNENQHRDASITVQDSPPLSPQWYEWQMVQGAQDSPFGSIGSRLGAGAERIGMSRLSQFSPLSSLSMSLFRSLDLPGAFLSDDAGASPVLADPATPSVGTPDEKVLKTTTMQLQEMQASGEVDIADKDPWLSDADWVYEDSIPPRLPFTDNETRAHCERNISSTIAEKNKSDDPCDALDDALRCLT